MSIPRPGPVSTFNPEREAFIFPLQTQAKELKADSQTAETVAANLHELVDGTHRIKTASMVMALDARENPYVLGKPYGFYSYNAPPMCNDPVAYDQRTDGIVALSIERVLPSLEF
ncbi:hypothetical protein N7457_003612 [Penicillium paradoxum]|uniref:uncharacterized protein n=1 Tax=Penicillium paradoxum TaxID=176176 RepID=UPI0025476CC1|nr:uncharacterized protein N7457_003612 [Penicillium paradoxum]KAJ5788622.1 hypothetical protein N7457_003612 [Penicillium paradoxum]